MFMKEYEQHEIGKCWPPLSDTEIGLLRQRMLAPGPKNTIILKDDKILDGWHQYSLCKELKIECRFEEANTDDPVALAIQRNQGRRQLDITDRAEIVDKLSALKWGSNQFSKKESPFGGSSVKRLEELAKDFNVGATTVSKLRIVKCNNHAELAIAEAVKKKEITIDAGYEVQRLPKDQQAEALTKVKKKKGCFYTGKRRKTPAPKRPEPVRPTGSPFVTDPEERGFPVNGTFREKDEHFKKYGRTQIYPKVIADILEHSRIVIAYIGPITTASSDVHPSMEQFFPSLDAMLAWVPDKAKGEQWATNFAQKARKQLAELEERLPILLERLTKLQEMLNDRKERLSK